MRRRDSEPLEARGVFEDPRAGPATLTTAAAGPASPPIRAHVVTGVAETPLLQAVALLFLVLGAALLAWYREGR